VLQNVFTIKQNEIKFQVAFLILTTAYAYIYDSKLWPCIAFSYKMTFCITFTPYSLCMSFGFTQSACLTDMELFVRSHSFLTTKLFTSFRHIAHLSLLDLIFRMLSKSFSLLHLSNNITNYFKMYGLQRICAP